MGLILAIDIDGSSATVARDCMEQGILVNSIQPGTLRFIPPLIVSQKKYRHTGPGPGQKPDQPFIANVAYATEGDAHGSPSSSSKNLPDTCFCQGVFFQNNFSGFADMDGLRQRSRLLK